MSFFSHFIVGVLGAAAGVLLMYYTFNKFNLVVALRSDVDEKALSNVQKLADGMERMIEGVMGDGKKKTKKK